METDILYKKLDGLLTPREEDEFRKWIARSPANGDYFRRLSAHYPVVNYNLSEQTLKGYRARFVERLAQEKKLRRRRPILRAGAAAAAAVCLIYLFTNTDVALPDAAAPAGVSGVMRGDCKVSLNTSSCGSHTLDELVEHGAEIGVAADAELGIITFDPVGGEVMHEITVERGGSVRLTLPDGSRVWVNSDSRLVFPGRFDGNDRTVSLDGEAYFEVCGDPAHPFVVLSSDGVAIRVLGTKFNVNAYGDSPDVQVTLLKGSVSVAHDGDMITILPDQQALFDRGTGHLCMKPVDDALQYASWTDGVFDFDLQPLDDIFDAMTKWYDVDIVYDPRAADRIGLVTMQADRQKDITCVMNMLHKITGLNYKKDGDKIHIRFKNE